MASYSAAFSRCTNSAAALSISSVGASCGSRAQPAMHKESKIRASIFRIKSSFVRVLHHKIDEQEKYQPCRRQRNKQWSVAGSRQIVAAHQQMKWMQTKFQI